MRFGQSLVQGLINPGYSQGLFSGAQAMGQRMAGVPTEQEQKEIERVRLEQQEQQRNKGLMSAFMLGQNPGQSDPAAALSAIQEGTGADATKTTEMFSVGQEMAKKQQEEALAKQELAAKRQSAARRATEFKVPSETIGAYLTDPDDLNAITDRYEEEQIKQKVAKLKGQQEINNQLAVVKSKQGPPELIDDVRNGAYAGKTDKLLEELNETNTALQTYVSEDGQIMTLPEKGSRVKVDGQWVYPQEVGLNKAPNRVVTGSPEDLGLDAFNKVSPAAYNNAITALGTFKPLLENTTSWSSFQRALGGSAISPVTVDAWEPVKTARTAAGEALTRLVSGAAIKDDEIPRFERAFLPTARDFFAPVTAATKLIRSATLLKANALLAAREITPAQARQIILNAETLTLSEKEQETIKEGDNFGKVLNKNINGYFGDLTGAPAPENTGSTRIRYNAQGERI